MKVSMNRSKSLFFLILFGVGTGCGGTSVGNPQNGAVTLQSNPLAGPTAASLGKGRFDFATLGEGLMNTFFGIEKAWATVSSFSTFQICLDTVTFERLDGSAETQNGSSNIVLNPGLLTFSPTSTDPMVIGSLNLTADSVLKDVKLTVASVPQLCGTNYSVRFDSGTSGPVDLTQNVAFRFDFPVSGTTVTGSAQTLTLFLGQVVDGMVTLANAGNLNNSTIQTVNVGQAQ